MASCKIDLRINPFTKSSLKVGHVVKLRNGEFRMVMPVGKDGTLILAGGLGEPWNYLSSWDDEFYAITQRFYTLESEMTSELRDELVREKDVVAVYGYVRGTCFYNKCGDLSANNRELLWERKEPKRMTVKEISNILGYEVEIVAD
jgi:hypothetical protein